MKVPVRNGTRFERQSLAYRVVVVSDGGSKPLYEAAFLMREGFYSSYTGHTHTVKKSHDIQPDEFALMAGGHPEWFTRVTENGELHQDQSILQQRVKEEGPLLEAIERHKQSYAERYGKEPSHLAIGKDKFNTLKREIATLLGKVVDDDDLHEVAGLYVVKIEDSPKELGVGTFNWLR